MDLSLFLRVAWRFRVLMLLGLCLALALALLSFVNVSFANGRFELQYREAELWTSRATVLVTQEGFPSGRSVLDEAIPGSVDSREVGEVSGSRRFSDPERFTSLAVVYSRLATSDPVKRLMLTAGPIRGEVTARAATDPLNQALLLPMVDLEAISDSPPAARELANRSARALIRYIEGEQAANGIAPNKRVVLRVVNQARQATLLVGRSKTPPLVVFFTVMIAVIGLAFVLENLRPLVRAVPAPQAPPSSESERRSA
jgi:hypothetical protein